METKTLTLTNFNGRKFTVHPYFLNFNEKLVESIKPLIIVIPGGSFDHLSLREGEPVALAYNSHGFNSVVMEYNLMGDAGKIYPDAALDVLSTVKYFREHADKYHIDPEKIVTIGFSAGGHVASVANNFAVDDAYAKQYGYKVGEVKANETILGYPLINIEKIGFPLPEGAEAKMPVEKSILDSALGVTRETTPTFIFQAWDDPIVLISNSIEYIAALDKNHVHCEAHLFGNGKHGFSLARPETTERGRGNNESAHVAHWFDLSLEWLDRQFDE